MASLTKEISVATEHGKDNDKKLEALKSALSTAEKKTGDLSVQISQMIERLESVTAFTSALEKITHLQDVDEMWESLITAHEALKNIGSDIEALKKEIEELKIKDEEQRQELNEKHRQFLSLNTESIELLKNEIRNKWEIWTKQQNA